MRLDRGYRPWAWSKMTWRRQTGGTVPPPPPPGGMPPPPPTPGLTGDANCSGTVDSVDALVILQYVAGLVQYLPCQQLADVNQQGGTNSIDASIILQYVAGLITHF